MKDYEINPALSSEASEASVLYLMAHQVIDFNSLSDLKELTKQTDDQLAFWLNISLKTLKNYRKKPTELKPNLQEHILLLIGLYKLGLSVFGEARLFNKWLISENFFLDGRKPSDVLNTISGIRFTSDRLLALEYGDNV